MSSRHGFKMFLMAITAQLKSPNKCKILWGIFMVPAGQAGTVVEETTLNVWMTVRSCAVKEKANLCGMSPQLSYDDFILCSGISYGQEAGRGCL